MNESYPGGNPAIENAEPAQRSIPVRFAVVKPYVTYAILGITVFVYLLQEATNAGILREPFLALGRIVFGEAGLQQLVAQGMAGDIVVLLGGKISSLIAAGQYWRLLTPALLHLSVLHIAFNMYALYAIGPSLEGYYGHWRFLALYLLGALGGNVLSFLLSPGLSAGASTAVFGLVGAQGAFIYLNRAMFGPRARPMLMNLLVIIVINLVIGLSGGIDNWGHLGGLVTGLAFAWLAGPVMAVEGLWPEYRMVDKRTTVNAVIVGVVILFILSALTLWGIRIYS